MKLKRKTSTFKSTIPYYMFVDGIFFGSTELSTCIIFWNNRKFSRFIIKILQDIYKQRYSKSSQIYLINKTKTEPKIKADLILIHPYEAENIDEDIHFSLDFSKGIHEKFLKSYGADAAEDYLFLKQKVKDEITMLIRSRTISEESDVVVPVPYSDSNSIHKPIITLTITIIEDNLEEIKND